MVGYYVPKLEDSPRIPHKWVFPDKLPPLRIRKDGMRYVLSKIEWGNLDPFAFGNPTHWIAEYECPTHWISETQKIWDADERVWTTVDIVYETRWDCGPERLKAA